MATQSSVMARLTQYLSKVQSTELPLPVVQKAKHHILDTLAAMVSGSQLKPGRLAIAYAKQQGGPPEAQVVASRIRVSAVNAALANGMLAHSDETDDSHAYRRHPSRLRHCPCRSGHGRAGEFQRERFPSGSGPGLRCWVPDDQGPGRENGPQGQKSSSLQHQRDHGVLRRPQGVSPG